MEGYNGYRNLNKEQEAKLETIIQVEKGGSLGSKVITKEDLVFIFWCAGMECKSPEYITRFSNDVLEKYNVFVELKYKDESPRTKTGKISKKHRSNFDFYDIKLHELGYDFSHLYN